MTFNRVIIGYLPVLSMFFLMAPKQLATVALHNVLQEAVYALCRATIFQSAARQHTSVLSLDWACELTTIRSCCFGNNYQGGQMLDIANVQAYGPTSQTPSVGPPSGCTRLAGSPQRFCYMCRMNVRRSHAAGVA
jgi:hypothetical protein